MWDVNTMTAVSVNYVLLVNSYTESIVVNCFQLLVNLQFRTFVEFNYRCIHLLGMKESFMLFPGDLVRFF